MDIRIIVAIIGLIGVAASAGIQYYLGTMSVREKKSIELKASAYVDFYNAVSDIASSGKSGENRTEEQLQQLTKAKTRSIVFGSDNVVNEIRAFFSEYGVLDNEASFLAFSRIVQTMREDVSGKSNIDLGHLKEALFGKK